MLNIFKGLWEAIVNIYMMYSDFIHSIFPAELGNLVEGCIDIAVAVLVVKLVSDAAFKTKSGEI